ncbi:acyltransferase family protein [Modestobacter sp. VKM Ac-2986]|uniref:acyltransferase family protein n=1 Tax=Modestobacter sp. VKM Ac-2986 TaxID=3004140 RepID=UPI0022AB4F96|nr:acyltransferase family protein [Modestobacter sp. VKM Ac-2986]MCZ2829784.1 acyltransferase family protein [Modestobacter sp. VKM Ac-2986]
MSLLDQKSPPAPVLTRRHRTEIEGLRALAVALVVGYHVFSGRVSGGVDVFLVLSGFFLVLTLQGQLRRTGRVGVLATVSRTLTRLLPVSLLVLATTLVVSALVVPQSRWREIALHLLASTTFRENHRLVQEAVDYSASNAAASPFQHFWSLSIQLQVMVVSPVVVAAAAALLRGRTGRVTGRQAAVAGVAAVTGASFAWSLVSTAADQQVAYFSTLPRLWELGAGALVALLLADARPGPRLAAALGWGGVVALVACGTLVDGARLFPGWQAAWPVACAVAVLLAGDGGGRWGVHRLLSLPLLGDLGRISFSLYLWHWPVLVLYLVHTGRESPSAHGAVAVIALSCVLAALTTRLVEQPSTRGLRRLRPVAALGVVLACTLPLLGSGLGTVAWLDRETARVAAAAADPAYPGAAALLSAAAGVPVRDPLPPPSVVRDDWPRLASQDCTVQEDPTAPGETELCVLGGDDSERRIVVVGDSHAAQWIPPLAALAEDRSWQVVSIVRGGCNLSTESEFIEEGWPGYEECVTWRAGLVPTIVSLAPDLVVALGTRTGYAPGEETVPPGFVAAWQQLSDAGLRVVGMRDSPRHPDDVPDCTAAAGTDSTACDIAPSAVYTEGLLETVAPGLPAGVDLLDTRSFFCADDTCPVVVGNVRVFLDRQHVTATYMRSTAPLLAPRLQELTGW